MSGSASLSQDDLFLHDFGLANPKNQDYPPLTLSPQHLQALQSLNYQQKVEYLFKIVPIPPGWQKSYTESGELFYINHNTRSTCWDPRTSKFYFYFWGFRINRLRIWIDLEIIEAYLQKQHPLQYQQHMDLNLNSNGWNLNANNHQIPLYQNQLVNKQMNAHSGSVGGSSSSCNSSNSVSPLFMYNTNSSGRILVLLMIFLRDF